MRILYCTTVLPSQRRTGGEIASQAFIDALRSAGYAVSVLGYRRPEDRSPVGKGEIVADSRPIESNGAGIRALHWVFRALLRGQPYSSEKYASRCYVARLRDFMSANPTALIVIDHAQMGHLLRHLPGDRRFVFVAHNVEEELYRSQLGECRRNRVQSWLLAREARLIGKMEQNLATRSVQTWVLTAHDQAVFADRCQGAHVVCFDLPGLACVGREVAEGDVDWDVGLIGTWTWGANALGLRWFIEHVVPKLPQGMRVAVAGKGADQHAGDGVQCLGFVADAMAFMGRCRVVCVPSIAGGGIQIKTIDAIASGKPVVATSVALRGIRQPPASVSVADDPAEFAEQIMAGFSFPADRSRDGAHWARQRSVAFDDGVRQAVGRVGG